MKIIYKNLFKNFFFTKPEINWNPGTVCFSKNELKPSFTLAKNNKIS